MKMIPTECCVSECDGEASFIRRPWPTGGCFCAIGERGLQLLSRCFCRTKPLAARGRVQAN